MAFNDNLHAALHAEPDRPMMEFKGRVLTAGELAGFGDRIVALLDEAGIGTDLSIGIILRNRPIHAAAVQGLVAADRPLTTIYAMQSPEAMARDMTESRFVAVIGDAQDWTAPVIAAAREAGTLGISVDLDAAEPVTVVPGLERTGTGPFRTIAGEPGLEILSSGTTGKPKRILFPFRMLVRTVESAAITRGQSAMAADITVLPFTGIGGMIAVIANPVLGRYSALLERFSVEEYVDAVRRLRPDVLSGPPTIPRMLIDAKVDPADLASVRHWYGGGAPFPPELQDEFEAAFGIRTIWAYGATEFCGTVVSWTPELDRQYRETKRGAVGKALPGVALRTVDVTSGEVLPVGSEGYMEVLIPAVREDWIRTTDIMMVDADGFVWHRGRGDGAIVRGGFKVLPETILSTLIEHPAVLDAAVIGLPDHRLGHVPVAAVELRSEVPAASEDELREFVRQRLPVHHVPTRIMTLEKMPRTTSLKADLGALRTMFAQAETAQA